MGTYKAWKKMFLKEQELENPPKRFYCVRRGANYRISEIYCVYDLADHIKERIYTLKEVLKEMEKDKKLRESNSTI